MSQNFAPHVRAAAEEIRRRVPGVMSLSTYPDHGSGPNMGEPFAVDIQIAPWGQFANKHQEAAGDAIQKIIENPAEWQRLGVAYVIWWGWYSESPGVWTKYDPGNYNNPLASPDPESAYHMDHVHIQFLKNHVYKAPPVSPKPPPPKQAPQKPMPVTKKPRRIKPNLVAVGQKDEEAMHAAAVVFRRRGFFVETVAGAQAVEGFDRTFSKEPLGLRQMIVVGGPALGALLPDSRRLVYGRWRPRKSDYIGAVGRNYEHTLTLLATHLGTFARKGAIGEFFAVLNAGKKKRAATPESPPAKFGEASTAAAPQKRDPLPAEEEEEVEEMISEGAVNEALQQQQDEREQELSREGYEEYEARRAAEEEEPPETPVIPAPTQPNPTTAATGGNQETTGTPMRTPPPGEEAAATETTERPNTLNAAEPALVRTYVTGLVQFVALIAGAQLAVEDLNAWVVAICGVLPLLTLVAGHLTRAKVSPAAKRKG